MWSAGGRTRDRGGLPRCGRRTGGSRLRSCWNVKSMVRSCSTVTIPFDEAYHTVVGIGYLVGAHLIEGECIVGGELEIVEETDLGESVAVECVPLRLVHVKDICLDRVGTRPLRTGETFTLALGVEAAECHVTIVHHGDAVGVGHDVAVAVANIEGIDGGPLCSIRRRCCLRMHPDRRHRSC